MASTDSRGLTGARVRVERYRSEGTVMAERHGGHELSVQLAPPLSVTVWVRRSEASVLALPPGGGTAVAAPLPPVAPSPALAALSPGLRAAQARLDRMEPAERSRWRHRIGRNVVEALRFGLVPRHAVEALSVGLALERRLFTGDLARTRESGAVRVVSAPYGTGKSHALDVLENMAFRENFVVGRVELDAFECQPNHPRNIYRSLVKSLRVPGAPDQPGLAFLLDHAAATPSAHRSFTARKEGAYHEFLGPALLNWQALEGDPEGRDWLYQWISGEDVDLDGTRTRCARATARTSLLSLGSYTTLSSHFTNLLGGLASLTVLLGFSGLVLIFDEAEHLRLLSVEMAQRANDFFRGLVVNALGRALPASFLDGCYQGGRKKLPFHWRLPAHLCVALACTPEPGKDELLAWLPDRSLVTHLPGRLTGPEMEQLIERVATVYGWANPESRGPDAARRQHLVAAMQYGLVSGALVNLRQVVQTLVGALDLIRGRPGWDWARIALELERYVQGPVAMMTPKPAPPEEDEQDDEWSTDEMDEDESDEP